MTLSSHSRHLLLVLNLEDIRDFKGVIVSVVALQLEVVVIQNGRGLVVDHVGEQRYRLGDKVAAHVALEK